MLKEEIKNIDSSPKSLRKFGFTFTVIFFLLTAYFYMTGSSFAYFWLITSLHFLGFSLLAPKFLKIPHKIWMAFALVLGNIVSRIILVITFYLVITPINMLLKILRKDLLGQKQDKGKNSYWEIKQRKVFSKEDFENQF